MIQPGDGFGNVDIGRMGLGGDMPLEHLDSGAQVDAEIGDRRAMAAAFGKRRLELRGVGDLAAANVADQQCDAGPTHRLGRDPADIAIHVLGHQSRREAAPVLQAGGDDRGAQTSSQAVLQAEHDDRQPQRIGICAGGRRGENLLRQRGYSEQQRELEGHAQCR